MVQRAVVRILPLFQRETAKLVRLKEAKTTQEGKEPKPPKINNEAVRPE